VSPLRPLGAALNDAPGGAAYEYGLCSGNAAKQLSGGPPRSTLHTSLLPFLLGISLSSLAGLGLMLALRLSPRSHPEDGVARVNSAGQLLLPGHTHGDLGLRLAGCGGCAAEFQRGVVSVMSAVQQRAQAAQVNSGGAR
jgi:hypothetical protein